MKTYAYPATFEPGDEPKAIVVTFADFPEAITEGSSPEEARTNAAEALGLVMLVYLREGKTLPKPSKGDNRIAPNPVDAAKIAVIEAFRAAGISQAELSRRLGRDEKEVRRILDPMHATKIDKLSRTLTALGQRLVIGVEAA